MATGNRCTDLVAWVPVSERMPERASDTCEWSKSLLVTVEYPYPDDIDKPPDRYVEEALYHTRLKVWMQGNELLEQYVSHGQVIAWRDMPEPFNG
jgi:hypothetical protein